MKCTIRQWRLSDKYDLARVLNNKSIQDNMRDGIPYPYTVADAEEYITATLQSDPNVSFSFAIVLGKQAIGSVSVFRNENVHYRTGEMGYYVGEEYWNKGYATSAVGQLCAYIFKNTDIVRIYAMPLAHNTASGRVLEKNGFHLEGIMRSSAEKNGRIQDLMLYAKVKQ